MELYENIKRGGLFNMFANEYTLKYYRNDPLMTPVTVMETHVVFLCGPNILTKFIRKSDMPVNKMKFW